MGKVYWNSILSFLWKRKAILKKFIFLKSNTLKVFLKLWNIRENKKNIEKKNSYENRYMYI